MLSRVAGILFVGLLVAGVPVLSYLTARELRSLKLPRLSLYLSAVLSQWLLAILGVLVVLASRRSFAAVGFRAVPPPALLAWALGLTAAALAAMGLSLLLERWRWWPRESDLVALLLPETREEKVWAAFVLAPTAALCEEFLYRGYLLAQLAQGLDSLSWAWVASSLAFGLAHLYQGWNGAARAALLGALLAYPVVQLGSLYPSMLAHGLIDAVALVWLGPRFVPLHPES